MKIESLKEVIQNPWQSLTRKQKAARVLIATLIALAILLALAASLHLFHFHSLHHSFSKMTVGERLLVVIIPLEIFGLSFSTTLMLWDYLTGRAIKCNRTHTVNKTDPESERIEDMIVSTLDPENERIEDMIVSTLCSIINEKDHNKATNMATNLREDMLSNLNKKTSNERIREVIIASFYRIVMAHHDNPVLASVFNLQHLTSISHKIKVLKCIILREMARLTRLPLDYHEQFCALAVHALDPFVNTDNPVLNNKKLVYAVHYLCQELAKKYPNSIYKQKKEIFAKYIAKCIHTN